LQVNLSIPPLRNEHYNPEFEAKTIGILRTWQVNCIYITINLFIMQNQDSNNKTVKENSEDSLTKPDPETKNTTDPQEHMEGPLSSLMQTDGSSEDEEPGKSSKD
jgi:hypothetical protein